MSIHFSHTIDVGHEPKKVFAVLDDFTQTPKWLERCTGIEKLTPGPNAVGAKLRYAYREGGRSGTMDGVNVARIDGERLTFRYRDKMMEVSVDFHVTDAAAGSRLTHTIDITPKNFLARMFGPFIRRGLPKQTITAMDRLRTLLDRT
jgi:carbon monoxide dehydrogenase subunit G